jgi:hypothetical protein
LRWREPPPPAIARSEEALSLNEEYQSTNEELLASKEELQSLNEELNALNYQLQETLDRQRTTAEDLQNVLYSTCRNYLSRRQFQYLLLHSRDQCSLQRDSGRRGPPVDRFEFAGRGRRAYARRAKGTHEPDGCGAGSANARRRLVPAQDHAPIAPMPNE